MSNTHSDIHYRQSPDGGYQLCRGEDVLCSMPEVAICFDASGEQVVLHKHGDPERVHAWAGHVQRSLRQSGCRDMADDLTVIAGRFSVDDLNNMINGITGWLKTAHREIDGQCQRLPGPR